MPSRPASRPRSFLMAPRWLDGLADVLDASDAPCYVVSEALAEQVTGFHVHRGALASLAATAAADRRRGARRRPSVLVLEDVVDHTNVGAIFRCGAAFGFDAVLLAPRCADPLYRRSIKVGMGAVFTHAVDPPPGLVRRAAGPRPRAGFTTVALTLADDADPDRGGRRRASTGWPSCSAPRATGSRRAGRRRPTGARSSRCAQGIDSLNVAAADRRRLLRRRHPTLTGGAVSRRWPGPPASRRDSCRRPDRGSSGASCASASTAGRRRRCPTVWSVSCWRQRASSPSPVNVDRRRRPARCRRTVASSGRAQGHVAAGERQAALVVLVEPPVAALGQRDLRVAHDAHRALAGRVVAVEHEHRAGRPRSGTPRARRRRRRTSSRPCRRPGSRSSSSYAVTGGLAPVHHRGSPAGDRADGAALGQRAVRRVASATAESGGMANA